MEQYIPKSALVAEIDRRIKTNILLWRKPEMSDLQAELQSKIDCLKSIRGYILNTLEVKEVSVWKTVDNINPPQADRNKIYCVLTKNKLLDDKYLTASVINHPHDEDLLQWKCTEFPFRCYDMCEGDKYLQIV